MREFATPKSRASALSPAAKVLYTSFCALSLMGLMTSMLLYDDVVRFGARTTPQELYRNLVNHYDRNISLAAPPATPEQALKAGRDARRHELLVVTHAHLFTMPVLLLIVGHLFLLTSGQAHVDLLRGRRDIPPHPGAVGYLLRGCRARVDLPAYRGPTSRLVLGADDHSDLGHVAAALERASRVGLLKRAAAVLVLRASALRGPASPLPGSGAPSS